MRGLRQAQLQLRLPVESAPPELPPYGLTLQAPWGALIAWGYKDIENRDARVAAQVGDYRGRVALTASVGHLIGRKRRPLVLSNGTMPAEVQEDIEDTLRGIVGQRWRKEPPPTWRDLVAMAGTWFATARVEGIMKPKRHPKGWHRAGAYGLVLRDVEVLDEFEPCTGGLGFFRFSKCPTCDRPVAKGSRHRCEKS